MWFVCCHILCAQSQGGQLGYCQRAWFSWVFPSLIGSTPHTPFSLFSLPLSVVLLRIPPSSVSLPSGVSLQPLLGSLPTLPLSPLLCTSSKRLCVPPYSIYPVHFPLSPKISLSLLFFTLFQLAASHSQVIPPLRSLSISGPFPPPFLSSHLPFPFSPQPISSSFSSPLPSPNQLSPIPCLFD